MTALKLTMIIYKPKFFALHEFSCKCGCGYSSVATPLVLALDYLRRIWCAPIIVNSACRCAAHNAAVGGAQSSRHLAGLAADIRPRDMELFSAFDSLVCSAFGGLEGWELKIYSRFIHLAIPRGRYPDWTGGKIYFEAKA